MGAFLTIVVGSALWISSGWQDGSTAVMLAGVFLALFAASDDPLVPLKAFLLGTMIATLLGALYGYVIMPRLDGFPMLMAAMAPPLLVLGTLMYTPRFAGIARSRDSREAAKPQSDFLPSPVREKDTKPYPQD